MFRIVQTIWIDQLRARNVRKEDAEVEGDLLGSDESVRRADARLALGASKRPLCLFGHTHYPVTFALSNGSFKSVGPAAEAEARLEIRNGVKYLLNPGSVGQPRDGDPRAAYAIVDSRARRVELFRTMYPVEVTQKKILDAGLPEVLARRLGAGR